MSEATTLEGVLKRDRAIVLAALAGLSALAWAYIIALAAFVLVEKGLPRGELVGRVGVAQAG